MPIIQLTAPLGTVEKNEKENRYSRQIQQVITTSDNGLFQRARAAFKESRQAHANRFIVDARQKFGEDQLARMGYTANEIARLRARNRP